VIFPVKLIRKDKEKFRLVENWLYECLFYPNFTRNLPMTYISNIHKNVRVSCSFNLASYTSFPACYKIFYNGNHYGLKMSITQLQYVSFVTLNCLR
jgi:hypothetical protein